MSSFSLFVILLSNIDILFQQHHYTIIVIGFCREVCGVKHLEQVLLSVSVRKQDLFNDSVYPWTHLKGTYLIMEWGGWQTELLVGHPPHN